MKAHVKISSVLGDVSLSGDSEQVRAIVEGFIFSLVHYEVEVRQDNESSDAAYAVHLDPSILSGKSYAELNRFMLEDLEWSTGPDGRPSTYIEVVS